MNILKTPLSSETVKVLVSMGVLLFMDKHGNFYLHKRYWNCATIGRRQGIAKLIAVMEAPSTQSEVANVE